MLKHYVQINFNKNNKKILFFEAFIIKAKLQINVYFDG
jgi:hypothetical protein